MANLLKLNAPGEIRTHGPRIRNPVLYPTELRGLMKGQAFTLIFFSFPVKLFLSAKRVFLLLVALQPMASHMERRIGQAAAICPVRQGQSFLSSLPYRS